jgi:hypothetical protein
MANDHSTDFTLSIPFTDEWWVEQIDSVHGLPPLADVARDRRCFGASRFYAMGDDSPDQIVTCLWSNDGARVEALRAYSGWGWPPKQCPPVSRWAAWVPRLFLAGCFRGPDRVTEAFDLAVTCADDDGIVMGGVSCYHSWVLPTGSGLVHWSEPSRRRVAAWRLIRAYCWLGIASWFLSRRLAQGGGPDPFS